MPRADKDSYNAYMADYRRRRRENGGKPLGSHWFRVTHEACDRRIAELEKQVRLLQSENRDLRALLPF